MLRILVVDDSSFLHSILRISLRRYCECQIAYAKHGADALGKLKDDEPDLILLDVNMPVMSGLEFLAHLKEGGVLKRVPVIIVSTEGEEEDVVRGLEAGATAYLRKPFKEAELHDLLDRVMGQPTS
jgi:two-component system, chemotaxis family, chemotaxis protein CheY